MFEKIIIAVILVLAAVLVFAGCDKVEQVGESIEDAVENRLEPIEDAIESKLDPIEDAVESRVDAVEDAVENAFAGTPATAEPTTANAASEPATIADADIETTVDPVQNSLDKIVDMIGDAVKENESTLHIPDSVVDNAVSSSDGQIVFITPEEAKRIALQHADVRAEDAVFDRTERDYDNGIYHYEVEFHVGLVEYDYDINARTGEILSFEKDR